MIASPPAPLLSSRHGSMGKKSLLVSQTNGAAHKVAISRLLLDSPKLILYCRSRRISARVILHSVPQYPRNLTSAMLNQATARIMALDGLSKQ